MYEQCPLLHQSKPSRELIFCEGVGRWWIKRAVFVLKILLKNEQYLTWQVGYNWPF